MNETINLQTYYPIIVAQGEIIDVKASKKSIKYSRSDPIKFRLSRIVKDEERDYQIDVVTEKFCPELLKIIETEISKNFTSAEKKK